MHKRPAVYIMADKRNGTLYIGVTSKIIQRVGQHREGHFAGFTKRYGLKRLVWYEWHERLDTAFSREKALKKWERLWKLKLIEEFNPAWDDLYPLLTQ